MNVPEGEETIFAEALRLPLEERAAYLAQVTIGNAELRQRVESLLGSYGSGDFLEEAAAAQLQQTFQITLPVIEKPGETIGRYKLLQQIGEGGCGVVYMAEQSEPVRRRVALKIIKLGMDTRSVIARFEAERQALALMDHPNIAKVLDAGATETGRPYFVMELVRGMKITEYCDEKKLATRARLDLFIQVCQAIQHAHQKGIIHRDIKPSNILVTINDGMPVPKVIDFGIAKATNGQQLTDKTLFTAFEQFIGTPAYMSPEQAVLTSLDIDTRSDIYALGVLLYELLTGRTPFDGKALLSIGLDEMRRTIREQEPPRPSTRLSTLPGQELSTTAQRRGLDAPKLVSELRGDLDWIVMKALEKDRARRYETANDLAMDVQRHLKNEPVVACPPGRVYRLQKLIRRNKLAFCAAAAVVMALVTGAIVSAWQAQRAKAERDSAEAVLKFFRERILAAGRPQGQEGGLGKDVTLRKAIDEAEPQISASFQNRPIVEAAIRHTLGESYQYLGEPALAVRHAERALALRRQHLGPEHPDTAESMMLLGTAYHDTGRRQQGVALLEDAFQMQKRKLGWENPATLETMNRLTGAYGFAGMPEKAVAMGEAALKVCRARLGPDDPITGKLMNNLSVAYFFDGKPDKGIPLLEDLIKLRRARLGPEHPDLCEVMHNLAYAYSCAGNLELAGSLYKEAFKLEMIQLGPQHPGTLSTMWRFVRLLLDEKKYDEAEKLIAEILPSGMENEPQPAASLQVRAYLRARRGQFAEAAADLVRVRETNPDAQGVWYQLAALLVASGQLDVYREHCRRSAERFGKTKEPRTADAIARICLILPESGADLEVVTQMADTAVVFTNHQAFNWFQLAKGLADYRQGRFAGAADWTKRLTGDAWEREVRGDNNKELVVQACMVQAMAHYRLKRITEARVAFAKGAEIDRTKLRKLESHDLGDAWVERIITSVLMREARGMIEVEPTVSEGTK
jgi:eukaryotic-like serine/threonine-protein kinase